MSFKLNEKPKIKKYEKSSADKIREQRNYDFDMKLSLTFLLEVFGGFGYGVIFLLDLNNSDWSMYLLIAIFVLILIIQWRYPTVDDK